MNQQDYRSFDAVGLADCVRRGETNAAELLRLASARLDAVNPRLRAVCIPMPEIATARAQQTLSGPFAGVPFLIKDAVQDYAGVPATSGSRGLARYVPQRHSSYVQRCLDAGLVIFGKTASPELALKANTESAAYGDTRNPWNTDHTPGGSSGGAAAAVAAQIVPMAGANDGGGSIRIPAGYCGLFGLRPSRGRVPVGRDYGEIWDGASSDLVVSRTVRDSAAMLDVLQGADAGAPFVIAPPQRRYAEEVQREPGRLRIGYSTRSPIGAAVDSDCVAAVENAARHLAALGHEVEEAEPAIDGHALARSFLTLYFGQVAATIDEARRRFGARERDFELDTRALGMIGRAVSAGDYVAERRRWNDYARALATFFGRHDLYMTPTQAQPPARVGTPANSAAERLLMRLLMALRAGKLVIKAGLIDQVAYKSLERVPFTQLANLTGTPAMSVPLAQSRDGLPLGVQFVAPFGAEDVLLRLAAQLEQTQPWAARVPAI